MDWLTFISKILEALAWPLAAVALVALLRKEIRQFLPLVKRLKAGPVEAEFERELKELRTSAESQPRRPDSPAQPEPGSLLLQLVEINPRSAILEAWQQVELAALRAAVERQIKVTAAESNSPAAIVRALNGRGLLSTEDLALFHDLRALRNQASRARDFTPTTEAALNYVALSSRLRIAIQQSTSDG